MNTRRRLNGERGTSLILALAFLSLLGVFAAASLSQTFTGVKTTGVARTRTDALYGADAGADFAVNAMKSTDTSYCPSGSTSLSPQPPTVNNATTTVTFTCSTSSSSTQPQTMMGDYSLVATGVYGLYVGAEPVGTSPVVVNVYGDVFSENRDDLQIAGSSDAHKLVINGDLKVGESPCSWNTTTDPMVTGSCLASQSPPSVSTPTVWIPSTSQDAPTPVNTSTTCTILYPGLYGTSGTTLPTFSSTRSYYMASGTYYFNGTGDINLNGWIKGGAQGTTTPVLSNSFTSRCPTTVANDVYAKTQRSSYNYTGSGVTIILGGNAVLRFNSGSDMRAEFFPRVSPTGSPDAAATDGVSLWAREHSTSGTTGSSYTLANQHQNFYTVGAGATSADVVFQGFTFMPDTKLNVAPLRNTDAGGAAQFKGGIYAEKIHLGFDNNTGTSALAGSPPIVVVGPRTFTFTVTTQQPGGGAPSNLVVVAEYPIVPGGQPTIKSWRKT